MTLTQKFERMLTALSREVRGAESEATVDQEEMARRGLSYAQRQKAMELATTKAPTAVELRSALETLRALDEGLRKAGIGKVPEFENPVQAVELLVDNARIDCGHGTMRNTNPKRRLVEIEDEAKAYDKDLKADDPRFRGAVYVQLDDGSFFCWDSSFAVIVDDDWLVVFTEHHRYHVFALLDVYQYRWFERRQEAPIAPWQPQPDIDLHTDNHEEAP